MLEMRRLAGEGDVPIGVEPVPLQIGREIADPAAGDIGAGLLHEGGIGLDDAVIDGAAALEPHLDDAEPDLDALEQGPVACLALPERHFPPHALGDVVALDENAVHRAPRVGDGLIDEVEIALLDRAAGDGLNVEAGARRPMGPAGAEHLVEQIDIALGRRVRQGFGHGATGHIPAIDRPLIGGVRQREAVFGAAEERDEARGLLEHLRQRGGLDPQPTQFGFELLAGQAFQISIGHCGHRERLKSRMWCARDG